jgi:hypothetical protein
MLGIVEHPPPENIRRGLMFLSKVKTKQTFSFALLRTRFSTISLPSDSSKSGKQRVVYERKTYGTSE